MKAKPPDARKLPPNCSRYSRNWRAASRKSPSLRPQLVREATADLVDLSLGIARRILHREISVDPAALEGLVGGALQKLPRAGDLPHPHSPGVGAGHPPGPGARRPRRPPLIADGTLERGAILVETARGKLDASLETQLAEIGRGLADRLPER